MADGPILTGTSVHEYFKGLLAQARANQGVEVADATEFYVVNLLAGYMDAERLFVRADGGTREEEPLAFLLQRAVEGDGREREVALRRLGDTSLYVSGFFSDHVEAKVVDADYYMTMGHTAYDSLAQILDRRNAGMSGLYRELASKFSALVDLLNEVSERVALSSASGVLRLYERFLNTGSTRLARMLADQGVVPSLIPVKGVQ